MGSLRSSGNEANCSTPKLSLSKLPNKLQREPKIMSTPPLNRSASIPFQWEEAPGKPRVDFIATTIPPLSHNKTTTARCLDLPPRLLNNAKVSPSLFHTPSISIPKGSLRSLEEELLRGEKYWKREKNESPKSKLGSWRWGSFKEKSDNSPGFSSCMSSASRNNRHRSAKISRIKSKSSFLRFSQTSSNLLAGVYGSFKQMVPWRRRQEQE